LEELREFDRVSRDFDEERMTAEMYEALPEELRVGEHPEWGAWEAALERGAAEKGWAVVTAGELAAIKGVPFRSSLTKRQCETIATTADFLGLNIEPDVRRGAPPYRWDERLALFPSDGEKVTEVDWHAFTSAAALLELGIQVAAADDDVNFEEVQEITRHLERRFSLPPILQKRLEARLHLLREFGSSRRSVAQTLRRKLSTPHREYIVDFLIEVAAADGVLSPKEERLLRRLCDRLGVSEAYLDRAISEALPSPVPAVAAAVGAAVVDAEEEDDGDELVAAEVGAPVFDLERLRRLRAETRDVQQMLGDVLTLEASELEGAVAPADAPGGDAVRWTGPIIRGPLPRFDAIEGAPWTQGDAAELGGLPSTYHAALREVCRKSSWGESEFREMARALGLMPAAVVEAINEWTMEAYGDWLLEESDGSVVVNRELRERMSWLR
jgi:uncharacterized tellurite resistance protein B-like protein